MRAITPFSYYDVIDYVMTQYSTMTLRNLKQEVGSIKVKNLHFDSTRINGIYGMLQLHGKFTRVKV